MSGGRRGVMDSNSDDEEYQKHTFQRDTAQYRVSYPRGSNAKQVDYDNHEEFNKKRFPVSRSGNKPGRVKRVVSCKRKTHHLTVTWKKQHGPVRAYDAANKENEMNCLQDMEQGIFDMDPWEFTVNDNSNKKTGRTGSEKTEHCVLNELLGDHDTMMDVLFRRNLRLKVAFTLWQRNVGELVTYFLRIQDSGVLVDFLPLMSKSMDDNSSRISIGCCFDLFPLVREVLTNPYKEYVVVGLNWIHSVLKHWWEELNASGYSGSRRPSLDKNFQVFNQQLLEFWHQEPLFKSLPGAAGDTAKVIDSFLSQLN